MSIRKIRTCDICGETIPPTEQFTTRTITLTVPETNEVATKEMDICYKCSCRLPVLDGVALLEEIFKGVQRW